MDEVELTEQHFEAFHNWFNGASAEAAGKPLKKGRGEFIALLRRAYQQNYIEMKPRFDTELGDAIRDWGGVWRGGGPWVVKGRPDDRTFSRRAAEKFLLLLRRLLIERMDVLNIGIVSGSSTGSLVQALVESSLWDEVLATEEVPPKKINVVALNVTPVEGWELEGNANIATLRLAGMLRDKLGDAFKSAITPIGLGTTLVIPKDALESTDRQTANRRVLQIADPARLGESDKGGGTDCALHLVITGVGSPQNSVFEQVLRDEGIEQPATTAGDVAFAPVDEDGQELELVKEGTPYTIYSVLSLERLRRLARGPTYVMLVARNYRKEQAVDKTRAIRAAIRGGYVNTMFTDEVTARNVTGRGG